MDKAGILDAASPRELLGTSLHAFPQVPDQKNLPAMGQLLHQVLSLR